jgi:hypothetical protein
MHPAFPQRQQGRRATRAHGQLRLAAQPPQSRGISPRCLQSTAQHAGLRRIHGLPGPAGTGHARRRRRPAARRHPRPLHRRHQAERPPGRQPDRALHLLWHACGEFRPSRVGPAGGRCTPLPGCKQPPTSSVSEQCVPPLLPLLPAPQFAAKPATPSMVQAQEVGAAPAAAPAAQAEPPLLTLHTAPRAAMLHGPAAA